MKNTNHFIIIFLILLFSGCTSYKQISYLKNTSNESLSETKVPEAKIFPNDLLTIIVNTNTPEVSLPFNLPLSPANVISSSSINSTVGLQTYLVGNDGNINFPVLGKMQVAGKTKNEVEQYIKSEIYPKYIKEEPIVIIRFTNFRISVLGEVARPGNFTIPNERVNIFDALALAGDLTLYGKRNNVLILRENPDGKKETARLNLQDKNIVNSPFYYLQQNDIVYVEPNKHKANSSTISTGETLSVSITTTLISLTSLLITVFK